MLTPAASKLILFAILVTILMVKCAAAPECAFESNSRGVEAHQRSCTKLLEQTKARQERLRLKRKPAGSALSDARKRPKTVTAVQTAHSSGFVSSQSGSLAGDELSPAVTPTVHDAEIQGPPPEPEPQLPPTRVTASGRASRLPQRFRDELPQAPPIVVDDQPEAPVRLIRRVRLIVRDTVSTSLNPFRLFRHYLHRPSYDPDHAVSPEDCRVATERFGSSDPVGTSQDISKYDPPWPFSNMSKWLYMSFFNNPSNQKSETQATQLAKILQRPDFNAADLGSDFNAHTENHRATEAINAREKEPNPLLSQFKETSVDIQVPSGSKTIPPRTFSIPGLYYQDLTSIIRSAFMEPLARKFHLSPFQLFHQSPESDEVERVYSELYNSNEFIEEHDRVQRLELAPEDADCKLERVVAGLMFWSDSTHLANFGTAKLWPIYLMFGNLSKYIRSSPTSGACHHVAYIPSLPDTFHDFASVFHAKWKSQKSEILTHCRRELMHAVWKILLDDAFIRAYRYGMVIECADGVTRRVFPRLFTYSADYPEKVLLATMRDKGLCLCPRCMVEKKDADKLGFVYDLRRRATHVRNFLVHSVTVARRYIYESGFPIKGTAVEGLLKASSSVPTVNAFIDRIGLFFNPYKMLVPDLLHEFELGVWKAVLTHLIRILYALPGGVEKVAELDERFRQIPAFGNSTIRHFVENASEMKKLAARDYEDLLQCSIPAFEGLLPEPHNGRVMKLLFRLAQWHALAKLRMHTDSTVEELRKTTVEVGKLLREFRDTTATDFKTYELPREQQARQRRKERSGPATGESSAGPTRTGAKKPKSLNLSTYKTHSMGDYAPTVKMFGTSDGYSTQPGELAHRHVKRYYGGSNKRNATSQIAHRYQRERMFQIQTRPELTSSPAHSHLAGFDSSTRLEEDLPSSPNDHHVISNSRNHAVHLEDFLHTGGPDPAKKNFVRKLKQHILGRFLNRDFDSDDHDDFTQKQLDQISITDHKLFSVKTVRVNYTTYDVRRDQDLINPSTDRCVVMVPSPEAKENPNAHRYWYAKVLGVFHGNFEWYDTEKGRMLAKRSEPFLWVRWMGVVPGERSGFKSAKLPKVGFLSEDDYAFGFLDPSVIIRASHLIPDFNCGRTSALLSTINPTAARRPGEVDDWESYYINLFVDRDMFMRYIGLGIGHIYSSEVELLDEDLDDVESGPVTTHHSDIDPGTTFPEPENNGSDSEADDGDEEDDDEGWDLGDQGDDDDGEDDDGYATM